jgi:hypothetical protein
MGGKKVLCCFWCRFSALERDIYLTHRVCLDHSNLPRLDKQLEIYQEQDDTMAAPGGQFFIQSKLKDPAPHHTSYEQLWETKWKKPVSSPTTMLQQQQY